MTNVDWSKQTSQLSASIVGQISINGAGICEKFMNSIKLLGAWHGYLANSELTGCCDEFLDGFRLSLIETCCSLTSGFVRPALFSIRAQIDVVMIWIYLKDHPVEWGRLERHGDGYMLKRDVLNYLTDNYDSFKKRFEALKSGKLRNEDDPYKILSAHVHFQSIYTLPSLSDLSSVVAPVGKCLECIELQRQTTEYINDVLLAIYADRWASLPDCIVDNAKSRLSPSKLKLVFA